jgi:hypothetical protein
MSKKGAQIFLACNFFGSSSLNRKPKQWVQFERLMIIDTWKMLKVRLFKYILITSLQKEEEVYIY